MRKIVSCELDSDLASRLTRFAQAAGSSKTSIIRMALVNFIEEHLRENHGVREKFEQYTREDEARAAAPQRGHLKVIK